MPFWPLLAVPPYGAQNVFLGCFYKQAAPDGAMSVASEELRILNVQTLCGAAEPPKMKDRSVSSPRAIKTP